MWTGCTKLSSRLIRTASTYVVNRSFSWVWVDPWATCTTRYAACTRRAVGPTRRLTGHVDVSQGWLRPQNDGCALRSITTMLYAKQLLAAGQRDYVAANIWTGTPDKPGVQRDLQYVVQVWPDNSGDPWEEVTGQIFFDKFVQRLALIMGAELATEFGNTTAATLYTNTAKAIAANIISVHWNAAKGIIMEVPNIRELDSATHLGVLYGYAGDDFLGAASEKVQSSVSVLVSSFASYTDFTINAKDTAAGLPGLLVGRCTS